MISLWPNMRCAVFRLRCSRKVLMPMLALCRRSSNRKSWMSASLSARVHYLRQPSCVEGYRSPFRWSALVRGFIPISDADIGENPLLVSAAFAR